MSSRPKTFLTDTIHIPAWGNRLMALEKNARKKNGIPRPRESTKKVRKPKKGFPSFAM
jgi:hypothetical protein